jgi:hypothetical protein
MSRLLVNTTQGYLVDECGLSIADACEGVALAQKLIAFEHCLKVCYGTYIAEYSTLSIVDRSCSSRHTAQHAAMLYELPHACGYQ